MLRYPELLLQALHYAFPRASTRKLFFGCLAMLTVSVGALGLVAGSPLRQIVDAWINIHLLFGALLCALLIARYRWCVRDAPPIETVDINHLSRHLRRIVYLALYGVVGFRELIALANGALYGGAADFRLFDEAFRRGPDSPVFDPRDDFQVFLASGLVVLFGVRAWAFRLWRRMPSTHRCQQIPPTNPPKDS